MDLELIMYKLMQDMTPNDMRRLMDRVEAFFEKKLPCDAGFILILLEEDKHKGTVSNICPYEAVGILREYSRNLDKELALRN